MLRHLRIFFTHPPSRAVGIVFALNSNLFGSWITRIPEIQENLNLGEGDLGLALLGMPIGLLSMMPFTGWIIRKLGTGRTTFISTILFCITVTLPVFAPGFFFLAGILTLMGISTGIMDIAMNAAAAGIEKEHKLLIMSSCHGMFSLGGMIGAGTGSILTGLEVSPQFHMVGVAILMVGVAFYLRPQLLLFPEAEASDAVFAWPTRPLMGLAVIGFCILVGEGAIADWSAIFLKKTLKASPFVVGLGYAGFSFAMALGRFSGDRIIPRWGGKLIVRWGSLLAVIGLGAGILSGEAWITVAGFTLVGFGFSCVVPIIFSAAAKTPGIAPGTSIAAVTSISYAGFLVGPPLIGFIAEGFGLSVGLGLVVVLSVLSAILTTKIRI